MKAVFIALAGACALILVALVIGHRTPVSGDDDPYGDV